MRREEFLAPELEEPIGHYCDAVRLGDLVFVSGAMPVDKAGELVAAGDFADQARRCLENLGYALRAAGSDFAAVAKLTIYVTDFADAPALTPVRREFFGAVRPAATLVEIQALAHPEMKVEIDAIAGAVEATGAS
ncbi:MAG TPA: Rid family hydrolase [Solirubrobacterales bacterium]|nr:Rid family hydrolase [Solirubrobacterales bacterium]